VARILLFLFLIFLAWLAVRVIGGNRKRNDEPSRAAPPSSPPPPSSMIEQITQCAWCGVHVPNASALSLPDGRIYCSTAHREQARAATSPSDRDRS
jgi:uncharacterized protein